MSFRPTVTFVTVPCRPWASIVAGYGFAGPDVGPAAGTSMRAGLLKRGGVRPVVIDPTRSSVSVNHRLPSGPAAIPNGWLPGVIPVETSVTVPVGVTRATLPPPLASLNQRFPSGPAAIPDGLLWGVIPVGNSVTVPEGVIRPTRSPLNSVNQRLPSGPAAIPDAMVPKGLGG